MIPLPFVLAAAVVVAPPEAAPPGPVVERLITAAGVTSGPDVPVRLRVDGEAAALRAAVEALRVEVRLVVLPPSAPSGAAAAVPPVTPPPAAAAALGAPALPIAAAAAPIAAAPTTAGAPVAAAPTLTAAPPFAAAAPLGAAASLAAAPLTATAPLTAAAPVAMAPPAAGPSGGPWMQDLPPTSPNALTSTAAPPPAPPAPEPEPRAARLTVVRTVEPSGRVVLTLVGPDGEQLGRPTVRHVMELPVLSQRRDDWGRVVRLVNDGSGAPIEVLLDPMGRFLSARALDGGGR